MKSFQDQTDTKRCNVIFTESRPGLFKLLFLRPPPKKNKILSRKLRVYWRKFCVNCDRKLCVYSQKFIAIWFYLHCTKINFQSGLSL